MNRIKLMQLVKEVIAEAEESKREEYDNFSEWVDSLDKYYNDNDTFVSVEFFSNKYNKEQNPAQETDKSGNLIPYKKETLRTAKWKDIKQDLKNNENDPFAVAEKYGRVSILNPDLYNIGSSDNRRLSILKNGDIEVNPKEYTEDAKWSSRENKGYGPWTAEMVSKLTQAIYPRDEKGKIIGRAD